MPPTSADNKGRGRDRGKGKVHHSRSTVMKVAGKVTHADNNNPPTSADTSADDIALTIKHSKSRVKSRPKTGNKRSSKHQGRPKSSRQSLLQKGSIQPKTEEGGSGCQRERLKSPREQMITELAAALKPASKTRTCKDGGAGGGGRRLSAIKQTGKVANTGSSSTFMKAKTIVGRISPEAKTKSTTKRPKTRPKSCPKSRGKVGGGAVLPNKSFGPKRAPKCAAGEQGPPPPPGKTNVQETAPGGGNTIIILGSPNDLAALELLKSLMKQINANPEAAKQPIQQSPSPVGVDAAGSEEVVTDQSQLEELYDAMYELTNNVNTMHDSYEQIIASLVSLQRRRIKTTKKEKAATAAAAGTLIPASASTIATLAKEAPAAGESTSTATPTDPTDISRFMDARTRADAFAELFATVDRLKEEMAPFYGCFDEAGYFSETAYAQNQITAGQRTSWLVQIRALNVTVEKLLAEYNREVLDMFRLTSTASSTG